ncbi:MAG: nucleoside monophosphate kinase [Candidatus Dependentiae bacterium]
MIRFKNCFLFLILYVSCTVANPNQLSVLINNKEKVANNNIKNITFVSVPFYGHFNILMKSSIYLAAQKQYNIRFIITGWENIQIFPEYIKKLTDAGIQVHIVNDTSLTSSAPMVFTFPRTVHLVDKTIELIKGSDVIIYDFFALEGYFAGQALNIPTICSIPAIVGPFNPKNKQFIEGIQNNRPLINQLEKKFNIPIARNLEMVSDAFLLPSENENIIWSWPKLIKASNYQCNRNLKNVTFVRPEKLKTEPYTIKKAPHQKLIYVSLGTVVTKNLWNNVPAVHTFVSHIFDTLTQKLGNQEKYVVVISAGRNPQEIMPNPPSNFHIFESVPQGTILEQADIFITHGGGNSVNEAIDTEVPMIVIPFFGDQHLSALNIQKLNIGISFLHKPKNREAAINTESGLFERSSLKPLSNLTKALQKIIDNEYLYKQNLKKIKQDKPHLESSIINNNFLFTWNEGDLLYGTNADRIAFAKRLELEDYFRIGNVKPFSKLFSDSCNINALPKLVDQYNDVLRSPAYQEEVKDKKFVIYNQYLTEYHTFLHNFPIYLEPFGRYPEQIPSDDSPELETLWNMCLGGLHFFISKGITVHFVINNYDARINKATTKEIEWIKSKWKEKNVKDHVIFYVIKNDSIQIVDPEKANWFQSKPEQCYKNLVLISMPGSGKGTFSHYLTQNYNYVSISPGDIFRSEINKQTEFGKKIQPIIEKGDYVDEKSVRKIITDNILNIHKQKKLFILEGFPHSVESYEFLHNFFQDNNLLDKVCFVELKASDQTCIDRILMRQVCKNCSHIYNSASLPPAKPEICDCCQGELWTRQSDTKEIVQKRLDYFHTQAEPIKQAVKKNYPIKTIDTECSLENLPKVYNKCIKSVPINQASPDKNS